MRTTGILFLLLLVLAVSACVAEADAPLPPVTFDNLDRVVVIGDNVASNPTTSTSYAALLIDNDDALFPDFAGHDLRSQNADLEVVRLDRGGDSYRGLASDLASLCTCGASCTGETAEDACIDTQSEQATLLVVALGANDLFATFLHLVSSESLRADPSPELDEIHAAIHDVLAFSQDEAVWTRPPLIAVTNVYDPSDGEGDLVEVAKQTLPIPEEAEDVTPELVKSVLASFNGFVAEEAAGVGAVVVDVHSSFLGHGLHNGDAELPHYDAADPTTWLRGFIDPNLRGAHEIRRTFWNTLSGETIDAIPTDLPVDGTLGLPPVPAEGWSDALAGSDITQEIDTPSGVVPNVSTDASKVIGAPDEPGDEDRVALGVLGAFVLVEMNAGEGVVDGEGDDLVVLEQGPLSGGVPEPYRVEVAASAAGPYVLVGDGAGERSFDLSGAGVACARFVRVSSQVHPDDVASLGSVFFPGPEIDAIGAVHPGACP